jgi:hypothetical protein
MGNGGSYCLYVAQTVPAKNVKRSEEIEERGRLMNSET